MARAPRVVDVYIRVSRIGSREHTITEEEQERDARRFADGHGLTVAEVFRDIDRSGGTLDRPGLQAVLERVEAGITSGVVVAYLSRLSRDTTQGLDLLNRVQAAGGTVFAPNLPDYTTADGKMLTTIQLAVDAGYRERKREELETAKAHAIEAGIPVSNRAPTGYRKDKKSRRLIIDPVSAPVVRQVFESRAAGAGPTELAKLLEAHGVATSQGSKTWTKQAVRALIQNRTYTGELSYGRNDEGGPRYVKTAAHPAIVSPDLWRRAQQPAAPRPAPARSIGGEFSLTGVLRCAVCGYSLAATTTSRGRRIYRCQGRHSGGTHDGWSVQAEVLEPAIEELFWEQVGTLTAVGREPEAPTDAPLHEALAHAQAQFEQVKTPEAQEAFGADYLTVVKERRLAVQAAEEELDRATAAGMRRMTSAQVVELRDVWDDLTPVERRELIAATFDLVALRRDGNEVRFAAWPIGTAPYGLSRRGFRTRAEFHPLDLPDDARLLTLQDPHERSSESIERGVRHRRSKPRPNSRQRRDGP